MVRFIRRKYKLCKVGVYVLPMKREKFQNAVEETVLNRPIIIKFCLICILFYFDMI